MEAEYITCSDLATRIKSLRNLADGMLIQIALPVPIWEDNEAALKLVHARDVTKGARHIRVSYHNVKQDQRSGDIDVIHCGTDQQIADGFTKALPRTAYEAFSRALGCRTVIEFKGRDPARDRRTY